MTMRYKIFGRSGLRVSELCLGTMTFGQEWGWGSDAQESRRVFDTFAEAGGNFVDTAYLYTKGASERLLGEFIGSDRDHFVLATKYSASEHPEIAKSGNSRKNMMRSIEESLKRLKTDYIDLYWLHAWDFMTPVDEVMRAFDDLVTQGKIRYAGISDTPAWRVAQMNTLADFHGWAPFIGIQVEYNLADRTAERDLLPMAKALDLGITAWSPLAQGVLAGTYARGANGAEPVRRAPADVPERQLRAGELVVEIAREIGAKPAQVALAALRQNSSWGPVIPIVGARKAEQLKDNLTVLDLTLDDDILKRLVEPTAPELGFPHEFIASPSVRSFVASDRYELIDNHHA